MDSNKIKVLVVEDNAANLELLEIALTLDGYRVKTARNGNEAIRCLENDQGYSLIITDYKMPGLNGEGFYSSIVERFPFLKKRLIFITGYADDEVKDFFVKTGCHYMIKPFGIEAIRNSAKLVLNKKAQKSSRFQGREHG